MPRPGVRARRAGATAESLGRTVCRWREPGESLRGQSFPPPVGAPPWDRPRIEVYVGRTETRADLAHTIAHELGHMHHTREAAFGPQWIHAR